jgi:GH15 family glucan-1,4-alpha-glucosidase
VARDGSIDWLCLPRFDSSACFAALLGAAEHGRWRIAPTAEIRSVRRRYRPRTLILETTFETDDGTVTLVDFMPPREERPELVRIVVGERGRVPMQMELVIRFDYGSIVPWVRQTPRGLRAVGGPDAILVQTDVPTHGIDLKAYADVRANAEPLQ